MTSSDQGFLRSRVRPNFEELPNPVVVVDLFAGCGGLTLGLAEAAREIGRGLEVALAVDSDATITLVFAANFPKANVRTGAVESLLDGELGTPPTAAERSLVSEVGPTTWLHGGPPCQGHSDLNNHTRRNDSRNRFYLRMARAAEVLRPEIVVIENVPGVQHDVGRVVSTTRRHLIDLGYRVADAVLALDAIGVPQRRRRHTLLALRNPALDPGAVLDGLDGARERDLAWAIGDLIGAAESPLDVPATVSNDNRKRIAWLHDRPERNDLPNRLRPDCHQGKHSYRSMYGKLSWGSPAQTITTGFSSMGQGRYVHPSEPRTLTPHEAARLQFFPDWFDFTAGGMETRRGAWATMIGNAVPPKLTLELGRKLLPHLDLGA